MGKIIKFSAMLLSIVMMLSLFSCTKKSKINSEIAPGNENRYNILVLGHDRVASLTDVMMVVSFDTAKKTMSLIQIPRDTYFEVGDYSYHKINGLYNYCVSEAGDNGSSDSELDGLKKTAEYLSENLGIIIQYSAIMDLDGFVSIVDAIGGVDMYVPYSMNYDDYGQNLHINLQEGRQTLDGNAAEQFVRFRYGYLNGDYARQDAQKMFMTAFIENVKKKISIDNVAEIATAIIKSVRTDIDFEVIVSMGTALLTTDLSKITMMSLPGEAVYGNDGLSYFAMNKASCADLMNKYFNLRDKEVTFDKNCVFCNENDGNMNAVYSGSTEDYKVTEHNAQDMSEKDIDIALN